MTKSTKDLRNMEIHDKNDPEIMKADDKKASENRKPADRSDAAVRRTDNKKNAENAKDAESTKKAQRKNTLLRIIRYVKPYMGFVILSLLLAVLSVALTLLIPIFIGNGVDLIVSKGHVDFAGLLRIIRRIVICIAVTAAAQWTMNHINNKITYLIVRDLRKEAFHKIHSLPLSYIDAHPTGDLISRVITDVEQLSDGILLGFTNLFTGIVTIVGTIIFMLTLQPLS